MPSEGDPMTGQQREFQELLESSAQAATQPIRFGLLWRQILTAMWRELWKKQ